MKTNTMAARPSWRRRFTATLGKWGAGVFMALAFLSMGSIPATAETNCTKWPDCFVRERPDFTNAGWIANPTKEIMNWFLIGTMLLGGVCLAFIILLAVIRSKRGWTDGLKLLMTWAGVILFAMAMASGVLFWIISNLPDTISGVVD